MAVRGSGGDYSMVTQMRVTEEDEERMLTSALACVLSLAAEERRCRRDDGRYSN